MNLLGDDIIIGESLQIEQTKSIIINREPGSAATLGRGPQNISCMSLQTLKRGICTTQLVVLVSV